MPNFAIPKPPPKSPYAEPDKPYVYEAYPLWVFSKINNKKAIVGNAEEHAYHTGETIDQVIAETALPPEEPKKPYVPESYPKWVHSIRANKKLVVNSAEEEEQHTGVPMNDDGTPIIAEDLQYVGSATVTAGGGPISIPVFQQAKTPDPLLTPSAEEEKEAGW